MQELLKKHAEKIRFGIVGVLSTIIDFVILFTLVALGLPAIASNFVSTSVASVFNFFAHKTFTYNVNNKTTVKHVISYIVVTLFCMWVIQPIVIEGTNLILGPWFTSSQLVSWVGSILGSWFKASYLVLLIGKGLATIASTIAGYILYRKFVFKK